MAPTNKHMYTKIFYTHSELHVLANCVAIIRDIKYMGYLLTYLLHGAESFLRS